MMTKPTWLKSLVVATVFFIIFAVSYQVDLHQQQLRYTQIYKNTLTLRHHFQQSQQQSQQATQYHVAFSQAQLAYTNASAVLPNTSSINNFLQGIVKQGQSDQLTFSNFNPQPAQTQGFLQSIPVQLTIIGTYQHLLDFLQQTAAPNTLVNWGNWTITREMPAATTLAENNADLLTFSTTAYFYFTS